MSNFFNPDIVAISDDFFAMEISDALPRTGEIQQKRVGHEQKILVLICPALTVTDVKSKTKALTGDVAYICNNYAHVSFKGTEAVLNEPGKENAIARLKAMTGK
jgi:hypothetical protein